MKNKRTKPLEAIKEMRYHLDEITSTQERLKSLISRLETSVGRDKSECENAMADLETELFFHLPFHLRELRSPFEQVLQYLYGNDIKIAVDADNE